MRSIVTHPDVLAELAPYRELGTRLVLENMDDRKGSGRTAGELGVVFDELPEAGFCLDVAHAASIGPTMEVADELLDRFRSRLRQVHVSSLHEGHHVSITDSDEERFGGILGRCRDVPWILEAAPPARWQGEAEGERGRRPAICESQEPHQAARRTCSPDGADDPLAVGQDAAQG